MLVLQSVERGEAIMISSRRRSTLPNTGDKPHIFGDKGGRLNIILKISVIIYRYLDIG